MNNYTFNFDNQLKMSHGIALNLNVREILLAEIPNATNIKKATLTEDVKGTDWWVERLHNRPLSIDLKARAKDYGKGDLALETWSVIETHKIGWTRNPSKGTDYILWFWDDTRRWCLIPFPMLCRVFSSEWQNWRNIYRTVQQQTNSPTGIWHSECTFVPITIIWSALQVYFTKLGVPKGGSKYQA